MANRDYNEGWSDGYIAGKNNNSSGGGMIYPCGGFREFLCYIIFGLGFLFAILLPPIGALIMLFAIWLSEQ